MTKTDRRWLFILFPAITMLLGWGLRGYIGGGPYGAMIPGSFVALSLALLLGYRMETAAIAALFGAIGVGYGGDMTYGQTLGFLRESDTVYWGLLGCLVKGSVWGLLGGVVLGLGLSRDHYSRGTLCVAFAISVVAFYAGVLLINEPKLIYFSDPVNKPRDESWAGILFAALALLTYLRVKGGKQALVVPLRFALWGCLGGGVGFAGGGAWMVLGFHLPATQKIIGWWKVMEFFFGFCLGATFGLSAYLSRAELRTSGQRGETPPAKWGPCAGFVAYVAALFGGYILLSQYASDDLAGGILVRIVFGYILFGAVAIALGLHSLHAAWQVAITMTFFHTVLDYTRDLNNVKNFGYTAPGGVQLLIVLAACTLAGYLTYRFQRGSKPVAHLYLLAVWACYASSCVRSFLHYEYIFPQEGNGRLSTILSAKPGLVFVHGTFTLAALFCTWAVWKYFHSNQSDLKEDSA
jgi:hypothetical protein